MRPILRLSGLLGALGSALCDPLRLFVPSCASGQLPAWVCLVTLGVVVHIYAWVYGLSAVVGQPSVLPPLSDDLQLCPWTGRRDWSAFCPFAFR